KGTIESRTKMTLEEAIDEDFVDLQLFLNRFLNKYIELGIREKITGIDKTVVNQVYVVRGDSDTTTTGAAGWFSFKDRNLAISTRWWKEEEENDAKILVEQFSK